MNKAFKKRKLTWKEVKNSIYLYGKRCEMVGIRYDHVDDDYDYDPDDPAHY